MVAGNLSDYETTSEAEWSSTDTESEFEAEAESEDEDMTMGGSIGGEKNKRGENELQDNDLMEVDEPTSYSSSTTASSLSSPQARGADSVGDTRNAERPSKNISQLLR